MIEKTWWDKGIKFECQGSGKCCTSHGEYGFVYMNLEDRRRMAKHLKLSTTAFTKKYCAKTKGVYHLIERKDNPDCLFLNNKRCGVYEGRPTQCRTWPFWPEVMNAKTWNKEVKTFCPGVGKGKLISAKVIEKTLKEQDRSEDLLIKERV
jgi:uncharacterized protein